MAGKKDNVVVAVISELTSEQAAQITKDIAKAKRKHAPSGRGTIACMDREGVRGVLQAASRKSLEVKENGKKRSKSL